MSETTSVEVDRGYVGTGFEPYDPAIRNPYRDGWETVSDFAYETDIYLARAREAMRAADISLPVRSLVYAAVSSPVGWLTFVEPNPRPRHVRHREKVVLWDMPPIA